ncbi:MAG: P-type conjugative transfer ATPase TrbB [Gemmatimonadota bacterium]|nr:P-type conjugative transfer ATPase TrbB [Gemmatimonadota bacterium]
MSDSTRAIEKTIPVTAIAPLADRAPGSVERPAERAGGGAPREPHYGEMIARYLGPRVMDVFADDDVTEVYINPGDARVRLDTRSRGRIDSGHGLEPARVEMFLNVIATAHRVVLGPRSPRLQAELPTAVFRGARLQGFVPPLVAGPAFNIRKPPAVVYTLDSYVARGALSAAWRARIAVAVTERRNIVIYGGTNSGKTTFVNAILDEIARVCPQDRIAILEDTVEVQCTAPDHIALRTTADVALVDLVASTLRTSPDRIIVGEVRGVEALSLLDAWATGHPGGIATIHASSPFGALSRLDRLAQRANVPPQRELIAEAVHLLIGLAGAGSDRRVTDVVRVDGLTRDGKFVLRHLDPWDAHAQSSESSAHLAHGGTEHVRASQPFV